MAINKKLIHFKTFANFNSQKLSANEANTKYTTGISGTETSGNPDILYQSICFIKDTQQIWTHGQIYNASADGGGGDYLPLTGGNIEGDLVVMGTLTSTTPIFAPLGVRGKLVSGSEMLGIEQGRIVWGEEGSPNEHYITASGNGTKFLSDDGTYKEVSSSSGGNVPTKTSELTNDSGFITINDVPEVTVPTKVSELENDSGFITSDGTVAKADQLTTTTFINGVPFNGTTNVNNFVSCSTAAATAAKTVTIDGFRLLSGSQVRVKFTNANTASSPTLNVSNTGAKSIYYNGLYSTSFTSTSFPFDADKIYTFTYNGTYWVLEGDWLNTVTATSTSANHPLILGPSASAGATITSGDKMLYTDSVNSLYYNPSTNILFAPNLQVTTNLKFPAPNTTYPSANIGMGAKPTGTYNGLVLYNAGGSNSDKDFVNIIGETHVWKTDGTVGTVFANISGNAASATALETPRTINRMTFDGSANVSNYVVCSTESNTVPKVINIPNMTLGPDARIWIEFTNGNTYLGSLAASVTHINGTTQTLLNFYGCTGQQPTGSGNAIHYKSIVIPAGVYEFVYYNANLYFTGNYVSEKKPYIVVGSSVASANTPTIALNHTLHTVVNLSNPRALTFTVSDSSMVHDYSFEFKAGTTKPTVTFPSAWKWANGTAPTINASKTYHVSVVNNCAVIAEF